MYLIGSGQWKIFSGNELGALFGWWLSLQWKIHNPQVKRMLLQKHIIQILKRFLLLI